ncbi:hypothetical protein [Methylobacterium nodulans]|uniref:Uncharacterized protein n=1 Tax=Methylobacterium nodulans (strain LMG 21967 / CNCM I-2342 / ORS 2060) TaxID=460265 RepID=B8IJ27_METNO|nr:hypothetical protein [Methylobacterium nodulans]ACL61822.1 hypothetical protein Mnod_7082 [Methylobacterium nodulans ORS 2060]
MSSHESRALSASELIDTLAAIGRTVASLNAAGKQIRVAVVPDGLWIDVFAPGRSELSRLIPTHQVSRMAPYAIAREIEALGRTI